MRSKESRGVPVDLYLHNLKTVSQKQVFQILARESSPLCGLPESDLLSRLLHREKRSSSSIGDGVALPHLKFRRIFRPFSVLASLETAIECETPDNQPVDIFCLLLCPEKDGPLNLQRLASLSRLLRNAQLRESLRCASSVDGMRALTLSSQGWPLAA